MCRVVSLDTHVLRLQYFLLLSTCSLSLAVMVLDFMECGGERVEKTSKIHQQYP